MVGITGLLKIELPDHTVLLNDGGITSFGGDSYSPDDSLLGQIDSIDSLSEGIGQEIPALNMTFAPPSLIAVTALSIGAIQQSRVSLWIADYDPESGAVVGTPELRFVGFVDQPKVQASFRQFNVSITAAPEMEVMFYKDAGNGLSSTFHKSIYPGETGHDNATGLAVSVAWGVKGPPSSSQFVGGGGGGGGGRGGNGFQVASQ